VSAYVSHGGVKFWLANKKRPAASYNTNEQLFCISKTLEGTVLSLHYNQFPSVTFGNPV